MICVCTYIVPGIVMIFPFGGGIINMIGYIQSSMRHFQKQVKTISKLAEVCVMCKEEEASVTLQPCGHMYCQGM